MVLKREEFSIEGKSQEKQNAHGRRSAHPDGRSNGPHGASDQHVADHHGGADLGKADETLIGHLMGRSVHIRAVTPMRRMFYIGHKSSALFSNGS